MLNTPTDEGVSALLITKEELIRAPIEITFKAILEEIGEEGRAPDGSDMSLKIEPWPGGRWYRDLGNKSGHLWGHVQVIKPPTLLEITGPLFMSYPAVNHIQYRLTAEGKDTKLSFIHRGVGLISVEHREGVNEGWSMWLERIQKRAEK